MKFNFFNNSQKKLAEEKQKLIYDLENGGIKNLIQKMNCNLPYSQLIIERQKKEGSWKSDDDISTHAYKVSHNLKNPDDKQELLDLLKDNQFKSYKKSIFCCLSSLCSNTDDYELFDFLLNQIKVEENESIIISVLSRLGDIKKPPNINIEIIKKFVLEGTDGVRKAAIKALANSEDKDVETLLLEEFKINNTEIKRIICSTLYTVGTKKSIPVIESAYKRTRDFSLRYSIENVLEKINNKSNP